MPPALGSRFPDVMYITALVHRTGFSGWAPGGQVLWLAVPCVWAVTGGLLLISLHIKVRQKKSNGKFSVLSALPNNQTSSKTGEPPGLQRSTFLPSDL